MNLSLEAAQAIIVLLIDRAPKNHAELAGAQAAFETLSAALKEFAEFGITFQADHFVHLSTKETPELIAYTLEAIVN